MPGLMAARKEFGPSQPLKGLNISGSLHMTIQPPCRVRPWRSWAPRCAGARATSSARRTTPQRQSGRRAPARSLPGGPRRCWSTGGALSK
eukprot:13380240-Heterocapsa_arctica.AAC.1